MKRIFIISICLLCISNCIATEEAGFRILHFPKDRAVGRLKVWDPDYEISFDRSMLSLPGWILIDQAKDNVNIPTNKKLRLEVYEDTTDFSFLTNLEPNDIQVLFLQDTKVLDEDLVHLKNLTGLLGLDLSSTLIKGDGLVHLENLSSLMKLSFFNSQISDAGLMHLPAIKSLQHLSLLQTHIKGSGLKALQNLPSLESLELGYTEIVDDSLAHLSEMKKLKELKLYNTDIGDKGLAHIKSLNSLNRLYIYRTGITDAGLEGLSNLTSLEVLYLNDTQITGEGLAFLKNLPLTDLSLSNTNFDGSNLNNCIAWSKTLEGLSLDRTKISAEDLSYLS